MRSFKANDYVRFFEELRFRLSWNKKVLSEPIWSFGVYFILFYFGGKDTSS